MNQQGIPSYGELFYEEKDVEHILAKGPVILTELQTKLQDTTAFGSQGFREYARKQLKALKSGVMQMEGGELLDNPQIIYTAAIQPVKLRWTTPEGEERRDPVDNLKLQDSKISFDFLR